MNMNKKEIDGAVLKLVTDEMGMADSDVDMNTSRESAGADSLDDIELLMAIEERFDISISDSDAEGMKTVQDAADIVAAHILKK
jgi:acyl carrier protein